MKMAQGSSLVLDLDSSDEDVGIVDVEPKPTDQLSPSEVKPCPGKKRTCRGIASCENDVQIETEDESHHIYTTLVNSFRETKKKFSPQVVLAEISAENQVVAEATPVVKSKDSETTHDLLDLKDDELLGLLPLPSLPKPRRKRRTRSKKLLYKNIEAAQKVYRSTFLDVVPNLEIEEDDVDVVCVDESADKELKVKIRWRLEITGIVMKKNQKFQTILPKLAQKFCVPERQLLLSFNDTTIYPHDSPQSICLKVSDIIDCGVVSNKENNVCPLDPNSISLKLQSKRKFSAVLTINKLEPLSSLIDQYAKLSHVAPEKIVLKFDGETLDPEETPEDLELEDGFCIDVVECT